jgi:thiosulfate/3-mercaptopyruvate sulfurtransferase
MSRRFRVATALLALLPAAALSQGAQSTPMIVSTEWLATNLRNPNVVLLHVSDRPPAAGAERIPGTRMVSYRSVVQDLPDDLHALPSADSIRSLLAGVGVSDQSHVVLTGSPLTVTRLFYTIEYFGHSRVSALDGGLTKWKAEGRPVETTDAVFSRGNLSAHTANPRIVATTEWLKDRVGKPGTSLVDTRTEGEYLGTGQGGNGHLEGARRVEWRSYFRNETDFALQDMGTLMQTFMQLTTNTRDTVVAYCAVGYRASGTYFVARYLGLPVKLYDGSYDSWSKAGLPLTKTPTPAIAMAPPRPSAGGLPFVSPDGRRIAFNASREGPQGDTYVINADGTGEVRLTNTPGFEAAPAWIGNRVLTAAGRGAVEIVAYDLSGSAPRAEAIGTRTDQREHRPSPDGKKLLYSYGPFQTAKTAVSDLDGSNARDVTDGSVITFNAAWSPDGRQIAYTTMGPARVLQIGVMSADGSGARTITNFTADDGSPQWPSWSPDAKLLAVQSGKYDRNNQANNTAHIWIIEVATGKATKLAAHDRPYLDETPSFFPDGKRIAFQSDRTGVMQIWVMNVDGRGRGRSRPGRQPSSLTE